MRDAEQVGRSVGGSSWGILGAALTGHRRRIGASAIGRYQWARQRWALGALGGGGGLSMFGEGGKDHQRVGRKPASATTKIHGPWMTLTEPCGRGVWE